MENLVLNLPEDWKILQEELEENGQRLMHINANHKGKNADIDVYYGACPEGSSAEEQAICNYLDIVGLDDEDDEQAIPVVPCKFNNKNAWTFDIGTDDEHIIKVLTQDVKCHILLIAILGPDASTVKEIFTLVERNLRIKD